MSCDAAAEDPLPSFDVIWNTGGWPGTGQPIARQRLTAFFQAGGGYIGAGANGANFLTSGGLVSGLTAATRGGSGRSGIIHWDNVGGPAQCETRRSWTHPPGSPPCRRP